MLSSPPVDEKTPVDDVFEFDEAEVATDNPDFPEPTDPAVKFLILYFLASVLK